MSDERKPTAPINEPEEIEAEELDEQALDSVAGGVVAEPGTTDPPVIINESQCYC